MLIETIAGDEIRIDGRFPDADLARRAVEAYCQQYPAQAWGTAIGVRCTHADAVVTGVRWARTHRVAENWPRYQDIAQAELQAAGR